MIGALIMAHGDDNGIVIPPKLATIQVAIVPIAGSRKSGRASWKWLIGSRRNSKQRASVSKWTSATNTVRAGSSTTGRSAACRFASKSGPKDLEKNQVVLARRDTGEKTFCVAGRSGANRVADCSKRFRKACSIAPWSFAERTVIGSTITGSSTRCSMQGGFLWSHWCGADACEERIKTETKATIRCIPLKREKESGKCIVCGAHRTVE